MSGLLDQCGANYTCICVMYFTLYSLNEQFIILVVQGKKVVVIGTSFIGMEVAAYLSDKALSVECIDIAAVPFERVLGTRIGKALQQVCMHVHTCTIPSLQFKLHVHVPVH